MIRHRGNEEGLFIYALVESPDRVGWGCGGVGDAAVYPVRYGRMAAVVTRVSHLIPQLPEHLCKYDEVILRLHKCCTVVRPVMFGTIARDEAEIRRILRKIRNGMPKGIDDLARVLVAPTDTEITRVE